MYGALCNSSPAKRVEIVHVPVWTGYFRLVDATWTSDTFECDTCGFDTCGSDTFDLILVDRTPTGRQQLDACDILPIHQ